MGSGGWNETVLGPNLPLFLLPVIGSILHPERQPGALTSPHFRVQTIHSFVLQISFKYLLHPQHYSRI